MALFADSAVQFSPLLPLLVFLAEVCVVTIGTVRIIFLARGLKVFAAVLGFFEISIWLFAIGQIMQNLNSVSCYFAFAGGFTLGNYLGIIIETKLAIGTVTLRIVTHRDAGNLIDQLKFAGYGITIIDGQGATGAVKIVLTVIKRKELPTVVAIVRTFDENAFYSVDEVRETWAGIFPVASCRTPFGLRRLPRLFARTRSEKTSAGMATFITTTVKEAA